MTPAEIIAAAREIVNASTPCATHSYSHQHAVAERHALTVARELLRLHDGVEYSSEPPTNADWYWWKERINDEPSPRWFDGDPSMLNGGFWLRAEPVTASAMAALRAENELLRQSWDLQPDTKIISAGPNELLIETRTGDRRRVSMACPVKLDELQAMLVTVRQSIDAAHDWLTEAVGDYCKPAADEPIETLAEHLRLRCESAAKRLAEAKAALEKKQNRIEELGAKVCQMRSFMRNILEGKYTSSQLIEVAKIALGGVQVESSP